MHTAKTKFETLIKCVKIFNNGEQPIVEDIGISGGRIVARGKDLEASTADQIIDGSGLWALPGMFDIHTHYDLELEVAPALSESVRHGTTSVVIANCSLGLAFGAQRKGAIDPIVDCYARVENIPKAVLRACADKVTWTDPDAYLKHLSQINLGPHVVTLMPHSMLRIEVMGFEDSISRDPTTAELTSMADTLRAGLKSGYAGFSTDALPFHYLANQPNCDKTIPTQFAKYQELKELTQVVREEGKTWQATPPKDSVLGTLKTFFLTSGRFHGRALRTTVVAALDIANNGSIATLARTLAKLLNSNWVNGDFHMQALGAPFKTWSDGPITPLAEEIPALRRLNETDLEDRGERMRLLNDPEYIAEFKAMWMKGKQGWGRARLQRILKREEYALTRDLAEMHIDVCPQASWSGLSFHTILKRVEAVQGGQILDDMENAERQLITDDFLWVEDEADFVLQMFRTFDTDMSWSTVTANRNPDVVRELLMDPLLIPGFNDSGAHITNMAFYDVNLRSLKIAQQGGDGDVSYIVKRLTKDAADLFRVDGGTIYENDVADLVLIDPVALSNYDGEAQIQRIFRQDYQHDQLVNRSEGVVPLVMIGGKVAWRGDELSAALGEEPFGRLLKPVPPVENVG
ncbi:MAG: N-acyl-D-aspartate/D-glutamate deacylase [Parvibaculaceae bacterium]|jgi:N-acyl-D-aspartate/D-glutamate deacylase